MKKYIFIIIILLFSFTAAFGGTLPMRSYSADEGLVSNEITVCFQDSKGYIWFGTYNGLSRFDGKNFQNYKENSSTLGGSIIRDIKEDAQGNIWIAFTGGIARFMGNTFVNYTPEDGLSGADVINLWPDPKQGIWALSGEGVSYYDPDTDSFKTWTLDGVETGTFASLLSGSPDGEIYAINKFGFNAKNPGDTEFAQLLQLGGTILSVQWHPAENAVYLLTPKKLFKRQNDNLTEIAKSPLNDDLIDFCIGKKAVWAVSEKELWNVSTGRVYSGTELQEPALSRVMEDREGNLWLLTWAGAQRIIDYQIVIIDVPSKIITQIRRVNDSLWVAGDRGISCLDSSDNIQKQFDLPHIKDFYIDNDRIIAFPKNQIVIIDIENSEITKTIESPENYTCAFRSEDGTLWIGSYKGLMTMKEDRRPRMAEETATVWCFHENKDGLWVGTEDGLYNLKDDNWTRYTTEHGLSHNSVWHIAEHPKFGILIATSSGISRQKSDNEFELFTLPYLNINSIIIDKNQHIWAGTEKGVYRVNQNQESSFFIDRNRGLSSNSSCIKSVMISDNYAYFGTSKGLARIELSIKNDMTAGPLLDINKIELNGHPVSSLKKLEYTQNNVSFYFNAVYAYLPDEVEFSYQLQGMDETWKKTRVGQAVYTNLKPGEYKFRVQTFAEAGKQSPELSLSFEILPPFWLTKKGIIAEILSVLFLIFLLSGLLNLLQMRKQKRRQAELARMYEKVKFDHSVDTIKLYERIEKLEMQNDSLRKKLEWFKGGELEN
jgi:ligand-binding sensor domain-containing protein/preprotein translocase subunit YajC